jgi:hypothetical protein
MKIVKKHKRIFYRPGMISLVFIPLVCLYFFYKNDSFKVYGALEFYLPDDGMCGSPYPVSRKYKVFSFNNTEELEKNKLEKLQFSLRELKKGNDIINGIKIHFGEKTNYAIFIKVVDILYIEDMPTWQPDEDNIYVSIGPKRIKKLKYFICGTPEASRINSLKYEELEKEKSNLIFMNSFFKKQWILFLGYFGIVVLNIFALIKFSKR